MTETRNGSVAAGVQLRRVPHLHLRGDELTGKSSLLGNIALALAAKRENVIVLDSEWVNSCESFLAAFLVAHPERAADVTFLDFRDERFAPALNPLDISAADQAPDVARVCAEVISALAPLDVATVERVRCVCAALALLNLSEPHSERLTLLNISDALQDSVLRRRVRAAVASTPTDTECVNTLACLRPAFALLRHGPLSRVLGRGERRVRSTHLVGRGRLVLVRLGSGDELFDRTVGALMIAQIDHLARRAQVKHRTFVALDALDALDGPAFGRLLDAPPRRICTISAARGSATLSARTRDALQRKAWWAAFRHDDPSGLRGQLGPLDERHVRHMPTRAAWLGGGSFPRRSPLLLHCPLPAFAAQPTEIPTAAMQAVRDVASMCRAVHGLPPHALAVA